MTNARLRQLKLIGSRAFLTVALASTTAAAAPTDVDMSATAFASLESGDVLEVRAGRDLPLERDLVVEVRKLLSAQGYSVAERGGVIVTVDSTTALPGIDSRNAYTNEDRLRTMDMRRNDRAVLVPYGTRDAEPGASRFTLRMSAYRPGQSNLWVGTASAPDDGSGRHGTTLALAKSLVGLFGKSSADSTPK